MSEQVDAKAVMADGKPKRAFGRLLEDFGELRPAERTLLECARTGKLATIAEIRPEEERSDNSVRASFVRFLALGGDENAPVHEHGVRLRGAWLAGVLDLEQAQLKHELGLCECRIESIAASNARFRLLNMSGSRITEGINGDGLQCDGDMFLRDGFYATGEVRLTGATIGGNLECTRGQFENVGGDALSCTRGHVGGTAFLDNGFHATGRVRLLGATIGGNLVCDHGWFESENSEALICDRTKVGGNVSLCLVLMIGEVRLLGATISGDLVCSGATFENASGFAISCDGAKIGKVLFFREMKSIEGKISLAELHVGVVADDLASWEKASGRLILNGFTFDRFAGDAPTDADSRIDWLKLQSPRHLREDFRHQPWEQLVLVLRAMGHPNAARRVAMEKQERLREAGKIQRWARPFHWLYGRLTGYGYEPVRLAGVLLLAWAIASLVYWAAVNPAWFGSGTHLLTSARPAPDPVCVAARARADDLTPCDPKPPNYREFFAPAYALDVLLPVVNLGYKADWKPAVNGERGPLYWGWTLQAFTWFLALVGWASGLLLVGVLGGLVKKD